MFEKRKFGKKFARRNVHAVNKEKNRRAQSNRGIILPYMKNVFELIAILRKP